MTNTDRLDVLVNNAGAPGKVVAPADATADEVHSVYDTNVYGPIRGTHAFLPCCGQRTTEGTDSIVELAMLGADGPTGTFIDRLGAVAW
jgi:NAD(P)-dependent dehydrogenase (short-subunit alcohol dehydrogenase family)